MNTMQPMEAFVKLGGHTALLKVQCTKVRAEPERAAVTESIDGIACDPRGAVAAGGGTCAERFDERGWYCAPAARMAQTQLERSTSVSARSESTRSFVSRVKW